MSFKRKDMINKFKMQNKIVLIEVFNTQIIWV